MVKVDKPVETVAMRFKKGMAARGMSQKDIIDKTGLSSASLSQYATGKYVPKQDRIYLIAKALGVSEAWLMGYDVPMDKSEKLKSTDTDALIDFVLNDDAKSLVESYYKLNEKKQKVLLEFAKNLLDI